MGVFPVDDAIGTGLGIAIVAANAANALMGLVDDISGDFSSTVNALTNDLMFELSQPMLGPLTIKAQSIRVTRRVDVPDTQVVDQEGGTEYKTDNSAPHPRQWVIKGFIDSILPVFENGMILKPTILIQKRYLDWLSSRRQKVFFKTNDGEILDVLIENLSYDESGTVTNAIPVDVTVKEYNEMEMQVVQGAIGVPILGASNTLGSILTAGLNSPIILASILVDIVSFDNSLAYMGDASFASKLSILVPGIPSNEIGGTFGMPPFSDSSAAKKEQEALGYTQWTKPPPEPGTQTLPPVVVPGEDNPVMIPSSTTNLDPKVEAVTPLAIISQKIPGSQMYASGLQNPGIPTNFPTFSISCGSYKFTVEMNWSYESEIMYTSLKEQINIIATRTHCVKIKSFNGFSVTAVSIGSVNGTPIVGEQFNLNYGGIGVIPAILEVTSNGVNYGINVIYGGSYHEVISEFAEIAQDLSNGATLFFNGSGIEMFDATGITKDSVATPLDIHAYAESYKALNDKLLHYHDNVYNSLMYLIQMSSPLPENIRLQMVSICDNVLRSVINSVYVKEHGNYAIEFYDSLNTLLNILNAPNPMTVLTANADLVANNETLSYNISMYIKPIMDMWEEAMNFYDHMYYSMTISNNFGQPTRYAILRPNARYWVNDPYYNLTVSSDISKILFGDLNHVGLTFEVGDV